MNEDDADANGNERTTAPQSEFGSREVAIGVGVFVVGALVAFAIPVAMSL